MCTSMITKLFYGLKGSEQITLSEEYKKRLNEVVKQDDKMLTLLKTSPELLSQYRKATDALDNLNSVGCDDYYVEGFKTGLLLGIEVALSK